MTYTKRTIHIVSITLSLLLAGCSNAANLLQIPDDTIQKLISTPGMERPIPVYGFNGNNTSGPAWTNKTFRDTAASLQPQLIRYPAGGIANFWDWQNGWFENESTIKSKVKDVSLQILKKAKMPKIPNGLKELKLIADETGCDISFTLNMITRDVNDQINMLHYAENIGLPVKWIELGNEFNLSQSIGRLIYHSPQEYADAAQKWITALKKEFPKANIAVIAGNKNHTEAYKKWNVAIMNAAPSADAVIAHTYPIPTDILDMSGINFKKLYEVFLTILKRQIEDTGDKPIWVTEYNIHWAAGDKEDAGSDENNRKKNQSNAFTWAQALSSILMTSILTDNPRTQLVINHNITNTPVFAAIDSRKDNFPKLPNGIGMEAWLKAAHNMQKIQKINFSTANGSPQKINDYEILGWKFSEGDHSRILLTNFTDKYQTVQIPLPINSTLNYQTIYASKRALVTSDNEAVKQINGILNNSVIQLPPYSITLLQ